MNTSDDPRVTAFLDTNVLLAYLQGRAVATNLFSEAVRKRVRFAINPIVLQELLLISDVKQHSEALGTLQQELQILPISLGDTEKFLSHAREIRNRVAHSNELLILSSAKDCDYLITEDRDFWLFQSEKPTVVTPSEFLSRLEDVK